MDSIRVTAKTVEDAITEASIELGTSSDNIEYTVIEKGTAGFFGIGGKKAVIEAKRKFTDEDLLKEVFGDEKKEKKDSKEAKKDFKKEKKESEEPKKEVKKDKKEFKKEEKKEEKKEAKEIKKEVKDTKKENKKEENKKEENRNDVKREAVPAPAAKEAKEEKANAKEISLEAPAEKEMSKENSEPKQPRVPADPEEVCRRAETFLKDVFRTMEMEVEVTTRFEDDTLCVDLVGNDMGILIGKRGQTLDSLQYLTSLVVNKGKAAYVRVKLDTEDYRSRRKATLENLAKNIAYKVKKTRRPVFLEPMNPYERRIIHSALQNDPYVTTHSEGEEPCRKVVVTLRKK